MKHQYDFLSSYWGFRPIHYFRPLLYVFQLKRVLDGFLLYQN